MRKFIIFAVCIIMCMAFFGCEADSYKAFMSIESGTKTSWIQKHDFLDGTKSHVLNLGKEPQKMEIEIVTEEGEIDITITDKSGEELIALEDAKTGTYEFTAEGKVKIKAEAKKHRGSFEIKRADS